MLDQAAPVNEQPPQFHAITPAGGAVGKPFEGGNPDSWPGVGGDASKNGAMSKTPALLKRISILKY